MTVVVGRARGLLDGLLWRAADALEPIQPILALLWVAAKLVATSPQLLIEPNFYPKWVWPLTVYRSARHYHAAFREAKRKEYTQALLQLDLAISILRNGSNRPLPPARMMLSRAVYLSRRFDFAEALRALVDFIKALEIDRSLSRDDRQYLILYAAAVAIDALRQNGRYILMDELKPLWSADFSRLKDLKPSWRIVRAYSFRPPAVPFEYRPEIMSPPEDLPGE